MMGNPSSIFAFSQSPTTCDPRLFVPQEMTRVEVTLLYFLYVFKYIAGKVPNTRFSNCSITLRYK